MKKSKWRTFSHRTRLLLIGVLLCIALVEKSSAATLNVTDYGDSGTSTLRGVLQKANDGDVVRFSFFGRTVALQTELTIDKNVTIQGWSTTIKQQGSGQRVLVIASGKTVKLWDLVIQGGTQPSDYNKYGGGICNNGILDMRECTVRDNTTAFLGAGVSNFGTLTATKCLFSGNSGGPNLQGGGLLNHNPPATATLEECTFENNSATSGGGASNWANMTMNNCIVRNNSGVKGAGVLNMGTLDMTGCTFDSNAGQGTYALGGGVANQSKLTMTECTLNKNSSAQGGSVYVNYLLDGFTNVIACTITENSASQGGGIYIQSGKSAALSDGSSVRQNTPDQIYGYFTTDGTCTIGDTAGKASVAFGGIPEGVSPEPRKTTGEADVTAVENDLKNSESDLFKSVKGYLEADLGGLPGDDSAGLSGLNATLYDAFAYEDIPLSDTSGEGKLEVEFTASWPQNVRYYAALAEYEDTASGTFAAKGYAIPERGVQFEVKPGQPLPDGVTPPDFYEEGEGLMTWRNVIADNGPYDHDRRVGAVTFRIASIRAQAETASSGDSGCSVGGTSPFALTLGVPLLLLPRRNRRG